MIILSDITQGTAEWQAKRRGKVSGTRLCDVMGTPWDRLTLIAELIAEEGTEQTKIFRSTPEMERGSAEESFAVQAYEEQTGRETEAVGFCISEKYDWFGMSPDRLVKVKGKYRGGIEVKSPDSKTLIMYKILNMVPEIAISAGRRPFLSIPLDYKWQVISQFMVNEDLEWLDFLVWDPRFVDPAQKLYIIRLTRDMPEIQEAMKEAWKQLESFRAEWVRIRDIVLPTGF